MSLEQFLSNFGNKTFVIDFMKVLEKSFLGKHNKQRSYFLKTFSITKEGV